MKKIFLIIIIIFLQCCNGQTNNKVIKEEEKSKKNEIVKTNNESPINFLEKEYQINGLMISDMPNPYPMYFFSNKKNGNFTVNYIGKSKKIQYFWNMKNKEGFFSKYSNPENAAYKSDDIRKAINDKEYYIVASYLPNKYISYISGDENEFELKLNAKTYFYLYEDNKWRLISEAETSKIDEDLLTFEINLIQKDMFMKLNNSTKSYDGLHTVSIKTEATTTGMASISYNFNIQKNIVNLILTTYKEPNLCEGRYFANEKDNVLEIYYYDEKFSCVSIEPKFYMKKVGEKFYVKGIGGEGIYNQWVIMN
jgi:hypothetical protein